MILHYWVLSDVDDPLIQTTFFPSTTEKDMFDEKFKLSKLFSMPKSLYALEETLQTHVDVDPDSRFKMISFFDTTRWSV